MDERVTWTTGHGIVLLTVLVGIVLLRDIGGILIALGPTAYRLVFASRDSNNGPKVVLVSHLTALITGWAVYSVLAPGSSPIDIQRLTERRLRVVGSALIAFLLTTIGFQTSTLQHSMA